MVGKRLAQCLNRSLPTGVHLKALETYDLIFSKMEASIRICSFQEITSIPLGQPSKVAADLSIYSVGLFPLFQYASTQVKVTH
jgi:hypothetical protein